MRDLADAICSTKEENLKRAGIMMRAIFVLKSFQRLNFLWYIRKLVIF